VTGSVLGQRAVCETENGQVALDQLNRKKGDFVVCDRNMPVMNGIELLRAIRADENLKTIPVLMVMAEAKQGIFWKLYKPASATILSSRSMPRRCKRS
jgi:CheY-like chemotaxis protein